MSVKFFVNFKKNYWIDYIITVNGFLENERKYLSFSFTGKEYAVAISMLRFTPMTLRVSVEGQARGRTLEI